MVFPVDGMSVYTYIDIFKLDSYNIININNAN